jgi:hypothetical protein
MLDKRGPSEEKNMNGFNDVVKARGTVRLLLTDKNGQVKEDREIPNLVVSVGRAYMASRMVGTAQTVMSHMGLGASTTAPAAGQTALLSQLGTRVVLDDTAIAGGDNHQVQYIATFEPGQSTGAVTEAGIFNDATAGTMLCRTTFAVVNKGTDDTLAVTWTITINAS